jgi:AbiJ N-terminal domain 4
MGVFDLFSKRQKRLRGEVPDVYVYDKVPQPLRVQLVQILQDGIGPEQHFSGVSREAYAQIHKALCREYGVFTLATEHRASHWESVANHLLKTDKVEHVIDIVEIGLHTADTFIRNKLWEHIGCISGPDQTIREANFRFKEHGVGFEYVSGEVIRIDSQLVHDEVVKPALKLLVAPKFKGANDEFLNAHEHYRHGRHKECIAECLKAFESTMKSVCSLKGWHYQSTDTAKTLIEICMNNGLFPTFMQTHIGNLRSILESGVPTLRNKLGGHGQGAAITSVSESTARFVLHLTAANILLLVESM